MSDDLLFYIMWTALIIAILCLGLLFVGYRYLKAARKELDSLRQERSELERHLHERKA
jgi:high-affinity Fe2+/Pb2+ permease